MQKWLWARNPEKCVREAVDVGLMSFVWSAGFMARLDPERYVFEHAGVGSGFETMVVGDQNASYWPNGFEMKKPAAVWPVWTPDQSTGLLEDYLAHPTADDESLVKSKTLPAWERPKPGQKHVVVISRLPNGSESPSRRLLFLLDELQREYDDAIIHLHGMYAWRVLFGMSFKSVDFDFFGGVKGGNVILPNGRECGKGDRVRNQKWIELCGHTVASLDEPRERCSYEMRAAMWAAKHYQENVDFRTRGKERDPDDTSLTPSDGHDVTLVRKGSTKDVATSEGDKFLCDVCSLQTTCKFFRSGGVCSIPGTQPASLATLMKTRDASTLVDALGTLLATHSRRLERALEEETSMGGKDGPLDPEVTKVINAMFDRGVQLAKLLDPELRTSAGRPLTVSVNTGVAVSSGEAVVASNPREMMAAIMAELEAKGIRREDVTPEMLAVVLGKTERPVIDIPALPGGEPD